MGDGGLAVGAAALAHGTSWPARPTCELDRLDLGPAYDDAAIETALSASGLRVSARAPTLPSTRR